MVLAASVSGRPSCGTMGPMVGRALLARDEPGIALPAFERLSPPPPPAAVVARLEGLSAPGDVVLDLHGRGGWIARAAVERQRRAITLESSPLDRLLAEVVLRPPDLRHLDAAFQSMAGAPRRETSLKLWISDRFSTRCATCERPLVIDEVGWSPGPDGIVRPATRHYRCSACRAQRGGSEDRHAPLDDADLARAADDGGEDLAPMRRAVADRFPVPDAGPGLVDELLDLHTPRQLLGLAAILERLEGDLRAANVQAALRLAFLHAILPSGRLLVAPGRTAQLRIVGGRVRLPSGAWRERNPWLAFEDGYRAVRAFLQRLEGGPGSQLQARVGTDLRSLVDGTATVSMRIGTASAQRSLAAEARDAARARPGAGVRLVLAQPPVRPTAERLAFAYLATAWTLGREAAALLPLDALTAGPFRVPWGWQSAAIGRALGSVEPMLARDGRVVFLCDPSGPEPIIAAVLGAVGAGYRVTGARLAESGEAVATVELVPPGAALPPGPRTRANVSLPPVPGGRGDPESIPSGALFAPAERFEPRPFVAAEAARTITESAVEVLKARGEPARTERLLGEILVGLDRAGHLRRLVAGGASVDGAIAGPTATGEADGDVASEAPADDTSPADETAPRLSPRSADQRARGPRASATSPDGAVASDGSATVAPDGPGAPDAPGTVPPALPIATMPGLWDRRPAEEVVAAGNVERLIDLVGEELARPTQRRIVEIEPGRWWLADRADREAAAVPLSDRVEWAVFSLLSTAGPLSETAFAERIAGLFPGHDLPDEGLVRACLESYRGLASTPDGLVTGDDLLRRTAERTAVLALIADLGHRMGFRVAIAERELDRPVAGHRLADHLEARERSVHLPLVARAPADALADVDAIWYVRGRATIYLEVLWTAMLAEPVLRRHAHIPGDAGTVRFLVVAPERTELLRHKLERSPLLRAALDEDNWHLLKWSHLRTFAEADAPMLDGLEPFLGLDPIAERAGEQLPMFGG